MNLKTLVIHPQDPTTDFLCEIYEDKKDWTIIRQPFYDRNFLREQIKEHDRIVMLGHGTPGGLLSHRGMVIDSSFVDLLKEKTNNVYIWCFANKFVENYRLKGFATGMIISEWLEAIFNQILTTPDVIQESNIEFANVIKKYIDLEPKLMSENVKEKYVKDCPIVEFNNNNIFSYL